MGANKYERWKIALLIKTNLHEVGLKKKEEEKGRDNNPRMRPEFSALICACTLLTPKS